MNPMCIEGTPVEDHTARCGLYVKREDLSCPAGPPFSKTRGVYAHVKARPEKIIGVLDTNHSQGGWAVARACKLLNKQCVLYYPVRKADRDAPIQIQQAEAEALGAELVALQAGRSAVIYHSAKKDLATKAVSSRVNSGGLDVYMMPNALKLQEMITETVAEVARTTIPPVQTVIVSASSGTIAGGVWRGLHEAGWEGTLVVHQGYSRSQDMIRKYMTQMAFGERVPLDGEIKLEFVDEGYSYGDAAKANPSLVPWPSNKFYDLKAVEWWYKVGRKTYGEALLWNIG